MSLLGPFNTNVTTTTYDVVETNMATTEGRRYYPAGSISTDDTTLKKANEIRHKDFIEAEVTHLAQQLTRQSTGSSISTNTNENIFVVAKEYSTLNPYSKNFKAEYWMKNILVITSCDPNNYLQR
ncbi:CDR ABC transporter [Penicillium angulare]|uniref:CDR ABC transporter n=1 Tax=Penicillium angulare TaxID=116970 RepID=UPI0025406C52|nr:CDR ABC transporter [Penicillium angulare]KAJ5260982.1 CDR ABC transporter [Penicillium angulare]